MWGDPKAHHGPDQIGDRGAVTLRLLKSVNNEMKGAVLWGLQLAQSVDTNDQAFPVQRPLYF